MSKYSFALFAVVLCISLPAWSQKSTNLQEQGQSVAGVVSQCDVDGSLAANCGWEVQPPFTSWTQSGDSSFTGVGQPAHSGLWALITGPTGTLGCFEQNVPTDPAALYDLSFWLRNQDMPNRFQVSWDGTVIYDQTNMPNFPYTSSALLPVGDTSAFIGLTPSADTVTNVKFCFYNVPDYFWFDDVDVLAE